MLCNAMKPSLLYSMPRIIDAYHEYTSAAKEFHFMKQRDGFAARCQPIAIRWFVLVRSLVALEQMGDS